MLEHEKQQRFKKKMKGFTISRKREKKQEKLKKTKKKDTKGCR